LLFVFQGVACSFVSVFLWLVVICMMDPSVNFKMRLHRPIQRLAAELLLLWLWAKLPPSHAWLHN
jgi:hypothetical protein